MPTRMTRAAVGAACLVVAFALQAGPAQAQSEDAAQLTIVPAGPGTISVSPFEPGKTAVCEVDSQLVAPDATCVQRYPAGTRVTITAIPAGGARFVGWSDDTCKHTSRTCTLTMAPGDQYISARFGPVRLTVQGDGFGAITVSPGPGGLCPMMPATPPCTFVYESGTIVTLRREHAADGLFWIGACIDNVGGRLDGDVCRFRLQGDALVGAGFADPAALPPPLGSGIVVTLGGNKRGRVTGKVENGSETLNCKSRCSISGLTQYDTVRVKASPTKGNRFVRWGDGVKLSQRLLQLSKVTKIKAIFAKRK
jgi:hypothetical protein